MNVALPCSVPVPAPLSILPLAVASLPLCTFQAPMCTDLLLAKNFKTVHGILSQQDSDEECPNLKAQNLEFVWNLLTSYHFLCFLAKILSGFIWI